MASTQPAKKGKLLIVLTVFNIVKPQGNPSSLFWDIALLRILQFD